MLKRRTNRDSEIEILRIIATMGVILLHYNYVDLGAGLKYVQDGSLNHYILILLESVSVCAVNLFMIISGYYLCENMKRNLWKMISLILQVTAFNTAVFLVRVILGKIPFAASEFIIHLLPSNYFVILYCAVYLISPGLNRMTEHLAECKFRQFMILTLVLFCVYPTLVDILSEIIDNSILGLSSIGLYGSQEGYTIVNFCMMYLLGAYIKKADCSMKNWSITSLLGLYGACAALIMVWFRVELLLKIQSYVSLEYCNPLVILQAVCAFLLARKAKNDCKTMINTIASASYTVYLIHGFFLPHLQIEHFVRVGTLTMLAHIMVSLVLIYSFGIIAHYVYHWLSDPILKKLAQLIHLPAIDLEKV